MLVVDASLGFNIAWTSMDLAAPSDVIADRLLCVYLCA